MALKARLRSSRAAAAASAASAALALQGDGWNVVVAGRRKEELDKTVAHGQGRRRQDARRPRPTSASPRT